MSHRNESRGRQNGGNRGNAEGAANSRQSESDYSRNESVSFDSRHHSLSPSSLPNKRSRLERERDDRNMDQASSTRSFCLAGPVDATRHYAIPLRDRIPNLMEAARAGHYVYVYGARLTGKSSAATALAVDLSDHDTSINAIRLSLDAARGVTDLKLAWKALLQSWDREVRLLPKSKKDGIFPLAEFGADYESPLTEIFTKWQISAYAGNGTGTKKTKLVFILDDLSILNDKVASSLLNQIQMGFAHKEGGRFVHSFVIFGQAQQLPSFVTCMPRVWHLPWFSRNHIDSICNDFCEGTGFQISPDAKNKVFALTQGHPWLVNALLSGGVGRHKELHGVPSRPLKVQPIVQAMDRLWEYPSVYLSLVRELLNVKSSRAVLLALSNNERKFSSASSETLEALQTAGLVRKRMEDKEGGYELICRTIFGSTIQELTKD